MQGKSLLAADRTLTKVGRGVTLSLERSSSTVWLYNSSKFPVFALSPTTDVVIRLRPAQSACVYQWPTPGRGQWLRADEDGKTEASRQPDCILVSFVKGWAGRYKRQTILSCPCWVQVVLSRHPDDRSWNEEETSLS